MVDSTPPIPGTVSVKFFNNHKDEMSNEVVVQWKNFLDMESGIAGYEVGVGSQPGSQDVSVFKPVSGLNALFEASDVMHDGKYYYFQVKVRPVC